MLKYSSLLLFVSLAIHLHGAGHVTIFGYFPGAEGETIHLNIYDDLISKHERKLAASVINEHGKFEFSVPVENCQLLILRVFNGKNYLYAAPGEVYEVEYEQLVIRNREHDESRLFRQRDFNITVYGGSNDHKHLHTLVMRLDDMVATYLEDEVAGRIRTSHRASLEQFEQQLGSAFPEKAPPYFDAYARYYMAYLQRTLNVRGVRALFHHYLKDQPLLLNNTAYVDFFRSMFDNYLFSAGSSIRMDALENAVNNLGCFETLRELLSNDELLQDEAIKELVLLISIERMFSMADFLNPQLFNILEQAGRMSSFPEYRSMAYNLATKYKYRLHQGSLAAAFTLSDHEGNKYDLQDHKGQYVYLFFWAGWCPLSMQSIEAMKELNDDFHDQVNFIGVLVDRDRSNVEHLLQNAEFPFSLLHFGGDYELLSSFGVSTIPFYVLIGPDGRFLEYPFVPPHWGAHEAFEEIFGN